MPYPSPNWRYSLPADDSIFSIHQVFCLGIAFGQVLTLNRSCADVVRREASALRISLQRLHSIVPHELSPSSEYTHFTITACSYLPTISAYISQIRERFAEASIHPTKPLSFPLFSTSYDQEDSPFTIAHADAHARLCQSRNIQIPSSSSAFNPKTSRNIPRQHKPNRETSTARRDPPKRSYQHPRRMRLSS